MDINSSYITGSNINNSGLPNLPKQFDSQGNAFLSLLATALEQNPEYIYMEHHNVLTEEQIAELANRYDPENMDGEQYKALLEDLVNLGAISEANREKLKDVNMSLYVSGYSGENGQWVDLTREEAEARFGKSGDTLSGVGNNLQRLLQALKAKLPQKEELDTLSEITDTISAMRQRLGLGSLPESGPKSLMEQAKDINSELWINLRRGIIENAREKDELRKEEEKIKLLGAIIDNATGRNDPRVSAAVGVKLGMNADQEIFKAGYMPSELHTYLLSLSGGKTTFEMVEDEEEREDGKVTGVEGAASDKLHTAHRLPDDKLLDMAENYDPNNMTPEQYDEFLEKLVELGILSQEAIERVGYHGMFAEYGREIPITCTGPQNFTPAFQLSPVDNDIEGWIQNRLLWKPGITRESAKRDGFAPQYDRITEDEKTLSIISEVLADVKRQRAGISL